MKVTEMASMHNNLENRSVLELLSGINEEDHKVADAVVRIYKDVKKFDYELLIISGL